jgi:hypothetical protein
MSVGEDVEVTEARAGTWAWPPASVPPLDSSIIDFNPPSVPQASLTKNSISHEPVGQGDDRVW